MSGMQLLSSKHFSNSGGTLACNLPHNLVFVLFKTESCNICQQTLPIFNHLSRQDMRVSWGVIDMIQNRDLIAMSKQTSTPITAVPVLMLFVGGLAYANYKGKRTLENISNFLNTIISKINAPPKTFSPPQGVPSQGGMIQINPGQQQHPHPPPQTSGDYYRPVGESGPQSKQLEAKDLFLPSTVTPHNEQWRTIVRAR